MKMKYKSDISIFKIIKEDKYKINYKTIFQVQLKHMFNQNSQLILTIF